MKYIKLYEGFLADSFVPNNDYRSFEAKTEKLALELIEPLLEPIRDHYELEYSGLSYDKLQMYYNFKDEDGKDVVVDEKLHKLLKSLSAKLEEYGLRVLIEHRTIFKSSDIYVDTLSKDKRYKTGYLLIRDDKYTVNRGYRR